MGSWCPSDVSSQVAPKAARMHSMWRRRMSTELKMDVGVGLKGLWTERIDLVQKVMQSKMSWRRQFQ